MSAYLLGAKAIKKLVALEDHFAFYKAKFTDELFRGKEKEVFSFTKGHFDKYQKLPSASTLEAQFPELKELDVSETPKYYQDLLENRFGYDTVNRINLDAQEILKKDKDAVDQAVHVLQSGLNSIRQQRYRQKIMDVGLEAPEYLLTTYHDSIMSDNKPGYFGWPYMDDRGGCDPGDLVSFVGRPAMGKTYKMLYCALHNWMERKQNVLFVSMEMNIKPITQRIGAMYAHQNVNQLKTGSYSSMVFNQFATSMAGMQKEPSKFYVVQGNLTANVEEIYALAALLKCSRVFIDGAYMLKHPNTRLDRFTRVAENVEWMKKLTEDLEVVTYTSWQLSRQAAGKGKGQKKQEKPGLEDIGYTDAIGQISSIVIGILQDDGVETIVKRELDLMKGRGGEVGKFAIHWNFDKMAFHQYGLTPEEQDGGQELNFV